MRLIDADALACEAEHCIETTDAFIELINKMPTIIQENYNEVNERGNIVGAEGKCDILTGESRDALEYNITCCEDCYRYETCIKAKM